MLHLTLSKNWRMALHFWFDLYVPKLEIHAYKTNWIYGYSREFNYGIAIPHIGSFGIHFTQIKKG